MNTVTRMADLTLGAILLCASAVGQGAESVKAAPGALCDACLQVCEPPLSHPDAVLDDSTDSYLPAAARDIAKAAGVELAVKLSGIHREYDGGHFGRAWETNAAAIASLAGKPADEHASSAEIRSLKALRAALYADTIVGLQAAAKGSSSQAFVAVYQSRQAVLDSAISSLAARQPMRATERLAVCEVLAAYRSR